MARSVASIVLTSNRDRAEWPDLFGEPLLASAALDRLTHGAHFVEMTGRASGPSRPSASSRPADRNRGIRRNRGGLGMAISIDRDPGAFQRPAVLEAPSRIPSFPVPRRSRPGPAAPPSTT